MAGWFVKNTNQPALYFHKIQGGVLKDGTIIETYYNDNRLRTVRLDDRDIAYTTTDEDANFKLEHDNMVLDGAGYALNYAGIGGGVLLLKLLEMMLLRVLI